MSTNLSRSLVLRALLAVVLMVGFYGLALVISGVLIAIPLLEYRLISRVQGQVLVACWGAAVTILWALVPRPDRFSPPGPRLTRDAAPTLFDIIDDVASATGQDVPAEVYVIGDVNAWVGQRGGIMGFGSRRVMGLGLPLLGCLRADEVRAVIAHEFGHYCSGDVSLGPWIFKTRAAIGRSLAGLHTSWVARPFNWYARLFMRLTSAVSRRQEFIADETAAKVAGTAVAAATLKKVSSIGPAYDAYFRHEVVPLLKAGFLPPIARGFAAFLEHPDVEAARVGSEAYMLGEQAGEFDTHPSMSDRLSALSRISEGAPPSVSSSDIIRLDDPERLASAVLAATVGDDAVRALKPIEWEDAADTVYKPQFEKLAEGCEGWYGAMTVDTLPSGRSAYIDLGSSLIRNEELNMSDEARVECAIQVLTAGMVSALSRAGWRLETRPGHTVDMVHADQRLVPRSIVTALASGAMSADEWRARCAQLGLTGIPLRPSGAVTSVG
jgi:Zn-dependent protease with chaperone function